MIVAGLQTDIAWEDPPENFRRVETMTESVMAADAPPRLLVLPEMFATGFSMNARTVAAFSKETRAFLGALASRHSVFVLGGYAHPAEPAPANACSIFSPDGREILHFRKLHPFSLAREERHYTPGDSVETVEVEGVRVTPLICYDLRFPEPFRPAAPQTDLFCIIANWPEKRRNAWASLLVARAIENQAYVLGVNRVGTGSNEPHAGDSALVGPLGETLARAEAYREGVVRGAVDPREVTKVRRQLGFLKDRRPDLYRTLEERFSRS